MKRRVVILMLAIGIVCATPIHAETYEYDDLDRVTKVTYEDGSYVEYVYDANGNITETIVHQEGSEEPPEETEEPSEEGEEEGSFFEEILESIQDFFVNIWDWIKSLFQ